MPQGSPGQGRGMPQGILLKVFDIIFKVPIGWVIFMFSTYLFMYMIPMEVKFLSICYFHIHFHLTAISEVDEMYEN